MGALLSGLFLILIALAGCSSESGPVSLPIPFSGSLTADTNVAIAVGVPLISPSTSLKDQATVSSFPVSWKTVCSDGSDVGDVTFLSTTEPEVRPFPAAGSDEIERTYTLHACTTLLDGTELCSDDLQCFEFPTDYDPSSELLSFASSFPGATAEVRKAACSGHNSLNGQLIDAKFLMGMVLLSNGDFLFHTQEESTLLINGVPFQQCGSAQDSRIVMTLLFEGGDLPLPPQEPYAFSVTTNLFLPGSDQVVGTAIGRFLTQVTSPDSLLIDAVSDDQILIGSSSLIIKNNRKLLHVVPELNDPIRKLLMTEFADDPAVTDSLLENGIALFNSVEESESTPINCDPDAHEATGIFQDLCLEHGGLRAQLMCFVFADLVSAGFSVEGVWVLLKP